MPRTPKFTPVKKAEGWSINIPSSMTPDGKRVRRFFDTRNDARTFAEKLLVQYKNEGTFALGLSAERRALAVRAFDLMELAGHSDLLEVVREGLNVLNERKSSRSLDMVFDDYLASRKRSNIYEKSLKRSKLLWSHMGSTLVSDITPDMIEDGLKGRAQTYRNALLRELRAVFFHAVKRGWCRENPVKKVDFGQVIVSEREIYQVDEAESLLKTTNTQFPKYLPFITLGLFAGVRVYEMMRLKWKDIDLKESVIELRPSNVRKGKQRLRFVPIEPNLKAWLLHCRKHRCGNADVPVKPDTPVVPVENYDELRKWAIREIASKSGVLWKQNAMRHSYASYWLAKHKDLNQLALNLGHGRSLDLLHEWYLRNVRTKEADKFWGLMP